MGTASPPAHIVVVRTCVRVEKVLFNSFVRKYGALSFFCVFGRVGYHAPEREPIPPGERAWRAATGYAAAHAPPHACVHETHVTPCTYVQTLRRALSRIYIHIADPFPPRRGVLESDSCIEDVTIHVNQHAVRRA